MVRSGRRASSPLLLGLFLCPSIAAGDADEEFRRCPVPSKALFSSKTATAKVTVEFLSDLDSDVDLIWISQSGEEHNVGPVVRSVSQESFAGHAFRVYSHGLSTGAGEQILLQEYVATSDRYQKVHLTLCREFLEAAAVSPVVAVVKRREEFEGLEHPSGGEGIEFLPCEPEGRSDLWSCVRRILAERCEERHSNMAEVSEGNLFAFGRPQGKWKAGSYEDREFDWQQPRIPRLNKGPGFLKMNMTDRLRETLLPWYADGLKNNKLKVTRRVPGGYLNDEEVPVDLYDLETDPGVRSAVVQEMRDVLEWWSNGAMLKHQATYGARVYRRGSVLLNHVDRLESHLASAIMQVDQTVDKDGGWPVEILSEDRDCYEIYLQPGEMVLYEGARFKHGRPMRFRGDAYANVFTHFAPVSWRGIGQGMMEL